jgi:hypothetical protein
MRHVDTVRRGDAAAFGYKGGTLLSFLALLVALPWEEGAAMLCQFGCPDGFQARIWRFEPALNQRMAPGELAF